MGSLRGFLRARPVLALWLVAAALAIKAVVPQGYMFVPGKTLTVAMCSASGAVPTVLEVPMAPGKGDPAHGHKMQDNACPFGGLSHAAMASADPVLLQQAIAHVLALGTAPAAPPRLTPWPRVQPPLRGPPTLA